MVSSASGIILFNDVLAREEFYVSGYPDNGEVGLSFDPLSTFLDLTLGPGDFPGLSDYSVYLGLFPNFSSKVYLY